MCINMKAKKIKKTIVSLALSLCLLGVSVNVAQAYVNNRDYVTVTYKMKVTPFGDGYPYDQTYMWLDYSNGYYFSETREEITHWYEALLLVTIYQYTRHYTTY